MPCERDTKDPEATLPYLRRAGRPGVADTRGLGPDRRCGRHWGRQAGACDGSHRGGRDVGSRARTDVAG